MINWARKRFGTKTKNYGGPLVELARQACEAKENARAHGQLDLVAVATTTRPGIYGHAVRPREPSMRSYILAGPKHGLAR